MRVREEVSSNRDLVLFLVENKFSSFSNDDKKFVRELPIPKPSMLNLVQGTTGNKRSFSIRIYEKYIWLTGSETRNKLFCWYCLLFSDQKSPFCSPGYDNLKEIHRASNKHEMSKEHTVSALKYNLFEKRKISDTLDSAHIKSFNEKVRSNRKMIKHLLNMVILLSTQDLAFRRNDDSDNQGNFGELIKFAATLDENFEKFIDPSVSSVFCGLSKTIQNDLINSMTKILRQEIYKEIDNAACFSWEIDEATDIRCFSQMSIIFRFVRDGKITERFMGFVDVSGGRTADDIFQTLLENFSSYNISKKLVAQTYRGAAVMAGEINGLQSRIKKIAPQALFTHCYAHKLNLILQDSTKIISQCRVFFSNLTGLSSFFTEYKHTNILNEICKKRLPSSSEIRWNFKSRAVETIFDNRTYLIEVFDHIIENLDEWDDNSIRAAVGFKKILNDFEFLFILNTFNSIFTYTDPVFSLIQNKLLDLTYCNDRIASLLSNLKELRGENEYFIQLYSEVEKLSEVMPLSPKRRKLQIDSEIQLTNETAMKRLYLVILDLIISQIEIRFEDISKLHFLELVDFNKFDVYVRNFPEMPFKALIKNYKNFFDMDKLKRDLHIWYSDNSIFGNSNTVNKMAEFIFANNIVSVVPELYKLFCVILTLPLSPTSASAGRNLSTLKRTESVSRNIMSQDDLNNLALISIELGLVRELAREESFFDKIIDDFATEKKQQIDLIYKYQ